MRQQSGGRFSLAKNSRPPGCLQQIARAWRAGADYVGTTGVLDLRISNPTQHALTSSKSGSVLPAQRSGPADPPLQVVVNWESSLRR